MRLLITLLIFLLSTPVFAANRYFVLQNASHNWNSTAPTNWGSASNTSDGVAVPTSADDCFFDGVGNGANDVTITAAANCKTINFTGYANTVTHNAAITLTVAGSVTMTSGMTYTPGAGATIAMSATGTLTTGGKLLDTFTNSAGTTTLGDNLNFAAIKTAKLNISTSGALDMNGKSINGNSSINRVLITSSSTGAGATINNPTTSFTNADFRDISFSTASNLDLSAITGLSGDCGGNSITGGGTTLTFTSASPQTFSGTVSDNWSTNAWSGRVPLPQDNVTISSAFSSGQTITADMPRLGKNIDLSGMSWSGTATALNISSLTNTNYGSLTLKSGMTLTTSTSFPFTFECRGTCTLTSAGKDFKNVNFLMKNGTMTLQDAFNTSSNTTGLNLGTLNTNGNSMSMFDINLSGSGTRALNLSSSTVNINRASSVAWNAQTTTNLTFNAGTSNITLASSSGFHGGGLTYYQVTANGTSAGTMAESSTFNTLQINAGKALALTAGTTQTVTNLISNGTSGSLATLKSATGGSPATIIGSGYICDDFMSLQDLTAGGNFRWYAGRGSTNVSGNTNINFNACPKTIIL